MIVTFVCSIEKTWPFIVKFKMGLSKTHRSLVEEFNQLCSSVSASERPTLTVNRDRVPKFLKDYRHS